MTELSKKQTNILRYIYFEGKTVSQIMEKFHLNQKKLKLVMSSNNMEDYYYSKQDNTVPFEQKVLNITLEGISYVDAKNQSRFRFCLPNVLSTIALIISVIALIVSIVS
ncbi:unknown [Clostridium sp. CAG:411]|jgi:hypothetical protein|nr:unknown [Clostridium sp. CAG:411]